MSFTDAGFAIAMTLLVVEIGVPETIDGAPDDPGALLAAFADKGPLLPVLAFALSIPVAFVLPLLSIALWFLAIPLQLVWTRYRPAATGRYLA